MDKVCPSIVSRAIIPPLESRAPYAALKSQYTIKSWWLSGMEILIVGAFTAAAAYLIGYGVERIVDHMHLELSPL